MREKGTILVVVGTRPEAIKLVPVVSGLMKSEHLVPFVVSTGQHAGAVDDILGAAGLAPDVTLAAPGADRTLNTMFASVLTGLEASLREKFGAPSSFITDGINTTYPLMAVAHGDTTSAAAGALAAFHLRMPVAHVEAGLRTGHTYTPFPEELNRQLIARIAAFHLAPTTVSKENLIREGIRAEQVFVTGNTAIDALMLAADSHQPTASPEVAALLGALESDPARKLVVVTAHRRENWGEGLENIGRAVATLAALYRSVDFVLPSHPNPEVRAVWQRTLGGSRNVLVTSALAYVDFARLLRRAAFAISDSGGVQEEAPAFGTPVLVTRNSTERTEGLEAGTLELVGTAPERIVAAAQRLLDNPDVLSARSRLVNPYGDGQAAERIVAALEHLTFRTAKPARFGAGYSRAAVLEAAGMNESQLT